MTLTELTNLFHGLDRAHNTATAVLRAVGPGPAYDAAADHAEALDATFEAASDAYNIAHPSTVSIPV